ncbi:hypothetical protein CP02DC21_1243, partial [Chlamydia psittaci 02DC21]
MCKYKKIGCDMHLKVIEQKKKALNNILLKVNNEKN